MLRTDVLRRRAGPDRAAKPDPKRPPEPEGEETEEQDPQEEADQHDPLHRDRADRHAGRHHIDEGDEKNTEDRPRRRLGNLVGDVGPEVFEDLESVFAGHALPPVARRAIGLGHEIAGAIGVAAGAERLRTRETAAASNAESVSSVLPE